MLSLNFNSEQPSHRLKTLRFNNLKKYTIDNDLDVLFIQECWPLGKYNDFAIQLAKETNMDLIYHYEDGLTGVLVTSTSIVAKKGLHLRNPRFYKLPHSAPTLGNGQPIWIGLGEVNMLVGANITLPTGELASVWSTHLSTASSKNRSDQVGFALKKIKELSNYNNLSWEDTLTIVAGDMNAAPESPEMNAFRAANFVDLWEASHPFVTGNTIVGDETDPEYNPVVHGAGQFPSQTGPEETSRIDYIYAHIPRPFYTTLGRVFTAPLQFGNESGWMSDHFGLRGEIDLAGEIPAPLPSADSDFSRLPLTTVLEITQKNKYNPPDTADFTVSAERGLTIKNSAWAWVDFDFKNKLKKIYTAPGGTVNSGEEMSFLFLEPGDYPYKMKVRIRDAAGTEIVTEGVVHVYRALKNSSAEFGS